MNITLKVQWSLFRSVVPESELNTMFADAELHVYCISFFLDYYMYAPDRRLCTGNSLTIFLL